MGWLLAEEDIPRNADETLSSYLVPLRQRITCGVGRKRDIANDRNVKSTQGMSAIWQNVSDATRLTTKKAGKLGTNAQSPIALKLRLPAQHDKAEQDENTPGSCYRDLWGTAGAIFDYQSAQGVPSAQRKRAIGSCSSSNSANRKAEDSEDDDEPTPKKLKVCVSLSDVKSSLVVRVRGRGVYKQEKVEEAEEGVANQVEEAKDFRQRIVEVAEELLVSATAFGD